MVKINNEILIVFENKIFSVIFNTYRHGRYLIIVIFNIYMIYILQFIIELLKSK